MPSGTGYTVITSAGGTFGSQNTAGAIGVSGGWIYNALNSSNQDAIEKEIGGLDVCLSHSSP